MLEDYITLFSRLGLTREFAEIALGQLALPVPGYVAPASWYGFPPCLIPIVSSGSGPTYLGLWHHPMTLRSPTFVRMEIDSGRRAYEIARTSAQFFCVVILEAIGVHDGVTPEIELFAQAVGMENLEDLDRISLATGDDPRGLSSMPEFESAAPRTVVGDQAAYSGDFPRPVFDRERPWWLTAVDFETPMPAPETWPNDVAVPERFSSSSKTELFFNFLDEGRTQDAWLALNMRGWSVREASLALDRLQMVEHSEDLALMASGWRGVAAPNGHY